MNTITIPSHLEGFINTKTTEAKTITEREIFLINGELENKGNPKCPIS